MPAELHLSTGWTVKKGESKGTSISPAGGSPGLSPAPLRAGNKPWLRPAGDTRLRHRHILRPRAKAAVPLRLNELVTRERGPGMQGQRARAVQAAGPRPAASCPEQAGKGGQGSRLWSKALFGGRFMRLFRGDEGHPSGLPIPVRAGVLTRMGSCISCQRQI